MWQFCIEPIPEHSRKVLGDPSIRYMVLGIDPPASIVEWHKAQRFGTNLMFEEAEALEEKLLRSHNLDNLQ